MNEQALKTVVAFNNLPETPEIKEIRRKYMSDEISAFEFVGIAARYLLNNKSKDWIPYTASSIEEINKCKKFKMMRNDGVESKVCEPPLIMHPQEEDVTTHWRDCSYE